MRIATMATSDSAENTRHEQGGRRSFDPFDERVPVDLATPIELTVQNGSGQVTVRATDRPDVRIRSVRSGRTDRHGRLDIDVDDNRITIHAGNAPGLDLGLGDLARDLTRDITNLSELARDLTGMFGRAEPGSRPEEIEADQERATQARSRGGRFDILVEIPLAAVQTVARLRTASGELRVEGLVGDIDAVTASGELSLRRLSGVIAAKSASGDIDIAEVQGEVRARSASGDVQVIQADLDRCTVQTASGDVRLARTRLSAAGPVQIDTVSGDADLDLGVSPAAGELGAVLEFKTVSGDAQVAPPLAKIGKRTWQVGPGREGCLRLMIRTVSGDLAVKLALDVAESPVPPGSARRPRPSDEDRGHRADRATYASAVVPPVPPVPPVPSVPPVPPVAPPAFFEEARDGDRSMVAEDRWEDSPDDPTAQSPLPPVQAVDTPDPVHERERLAILTALERGEIDIDEAMRRLDPLGGEAIVLPSTDPPNDR